MSVIAFVLLQLFAIGGTKALVHKYGDSIDPGLRQQAEHEHQVDTQRELHQRK